MVAAAFNFSTLEEEAGEPEASQGYIEKPVSKINKLKKIKILTK